MNGDLYFEGRQYISSSRAAKISGYVNDYIGQLCRDGKLECRMVGRSWYVSFESITTHKNANGGNAKWRAKKSFASADRSSSASTFSSQYSNLNSFPQRLAEERISLPLNNVPVPAEAISLGVEEVDLILPCLPTVATHGKASHHFAFEKNFPKIVGAMLALLFAVSAFQFSVSMNKDAQLVYGNFVHEIATSLYISFPSGSNFLASVATATESSFGQFAISFYKTIQGVLFNTRERIIVLFGGEIPQEKQPQHIAQAPQTSSEGQGLVVVPVDSLLDQEAVIAKIKDSFSDEVNVLPKNDGVSGVITPMFRKVSDQDYLYVLVPLKN